MSNKEEPHPMLYEAMREAPSATDPAEDSLTFAAAALGAAGHEIIDPYLHTLTEQFARGEITFQEASEKPSLHPLSLSTPAAIRRHTFRSWDDYFIPHTTVLRNKFTSPNKPYGETDPTRFRALEEYYASLRLVELFKNPLRGHFDYAHMKAIHRYIFQDVFEWAGHERVGPSTFMVKDGHAYYPAGPALSAAAEAEYTKIATTNYLRDLEQDNFVQELAERWGELNVIHSFREGNTRSQFVFFSQLCEHSGYHLIAETFLPDSPLRDEFVRARFHSQDTGRNDVLARVLTQMLTRADTSR